MELRLLAKHNPDNRVRIASSGAIPPLTALLAHPDPLLQEHAVTALLNLALCDANKALLLDAGAVRPLVRALKAAASPAARENAACALLRLAQLDGAAADDALIAVVRGDYPRVAKEKALFWLGQSGSPRALEFIDSVLARSSPPAT
jgi:hypothetical protein